MTDVIKVCRRTWKLLGVPMDVRAELVDELEADLALAAIEGVEAVDYVGGNPREFAAEWARARGAVKPRLRLVATAVAALVGAMPGVAFALFAAYGLSSAALGEMFGEPTRVGENLYESRFFPPEWLYLSMYTLGAAFAYAGAIAAVAGLLYFRLDPAVSVTVRKLFFALPLVIAAAVGATIAFAWTQAFSDDSTTVLLDCGVAAVVFGAGVMLIRYAAVRRLRLREALSTPAPAL